MVQMPEGLEYWTADEVAEVLYPSAEIASKLWKILSEAKNPTPLGGDGTGGTVETPDMRLDVRNDDKASHWWSKFTEQEQQLIADAFHKEVGG